MKTKLRIAAALIMATATLTNAMESTEQQGFFPWYIDNPRCDIQLPLPLHPVGLSTDKLTPKCLSNMPPMESIFTVKTYLQIIFECTTKTLTKLREVNQFTRDAIDRTQEEFVFQLITTRKIALILDIVDSPQCAHGSVLGYGIDSGAAAFEKSYRLDGILPRNIEELRNWCSKGYQCAKGERLHLERRMSNNEYTRWMTTEHYSFRLFCYGIYNGCAPLVSYIMEHHNNFWERKELVRELHFTLKEEKRKIHEGQKVDAYAYSFMDYLIRQDFVHIIHFAINNKELRDFAFGKGPKLKCGTLLHTLAEYGSQAMITRFFREEELVALCLRPENIKNRDRKIPEEIAEETGRPQEIINLFRFQIHFPKFHLLSYISYRENEPIPMDVIHLIFRYAFLTPEYTPRK